MGKQWKHIIIFFIVVVFLFSHINLVSADSKFKDVVRYEEEINYLTGLGIIKGYGDEFRPVEPIKRIQAVQMILNAKNIELGNAPDPGLKDVFTDSYGYDYIAKAVELGIIKGKDNGTFDAFGTLTRDQMAVILARSYSLSGEAPNFRDIPMGHFAEEAIDALRANGVTNGYADGSFRPRGNLSREQFAVFMARILNDNFKLLTEEEKSTLMAGHQSREMIYEGGWIYYSIEGKGIYRKNATTQTVEKITDYYGNQLFIYDNWLYYRNHVDNTNIYKIKLDGSSNMMVEKEGVVSFWIDQGYLYYVTSNVINKDGKSEIIKINIKEPEQKQIMRTYYNTDGFDSALTSIQINDGWIYFEKSESWDDYKRYTRLKTDNSLLEELPYPEPFVRRYPGGIGTKVGETGMDYVVHNDWVYYNDIHGNLFRREANGSKSQELYNSDDQVYSMNVSKIYIYNEKIYTIGSGTIIYRDNDRFESHIDDTKAKIMEMDLNGDHKKIVKEIDRTNTPIDVFEVYLLDGAFYHLYNNEPKSYFNLN